MLLQMGVFALFLLSAGCTVQGQAIEEPPDVARLALAWTYDSGGVIHQPPKRVGDVVIVIPAGGPVLALDVSSGSLRWQFAPQGRIWERSFAVGQGRVFVGLEGERLLALDAASGDVLWARELGIDVQVPPLVAGDVLYVPTTFVGPGLASDAQGRARLFALKAANGEVIWSFESDNYVLQTPFLVDGVLYLAGSYDDPAHEIDEGGAMRLYALNASDGAPRWSYQSQDGFVKAIYATKQAVTFVGYEDYVSAVDAQTGKLLWRRDAGNWVPSLSGADGVVYYGSANTVVHAWHSQNGQTIWEYNIGGGAFNYVLGAPERVGDTLYFLTQRGGIMALNALDGSLLWEIPTGVRARAGLTVSGSRLLFSDENGRVYAYTNRDE